MVRYRRNLIAGGTFLFTVTLVDRASQGLVDHVDALRAAMRQTRRSHPFVIDAVAVLPGPLAHCHDLAGRGRGLPEPMAPHKAAIYRRRHEIGGSSRTSPKRRTCAVAASILGTHHPGRQGFRATCRLYAFQSSKARLGRSGARMAVLLVSRLCATRLVAARLGRRFQSGSNKLRRASLVTPDFASAQSGLRAAYIYRRAFMYPFGR
jgi:hypothetical protein